MEEVIVVFEISNLQNIDTDLRTVFISRPFLPLINVEVKIFFSATMSEKIIASESSQIFIFGEILQRDVCTPHIPGIYTVHTSYD